jgi:hypothetical protein
MKKALYPCRTIFVILTMLFFINFPLKSIAGISDSTIYDITIDKDTYSVGDVATVIVFIYNPDSVNHTYWVTLDIKNANGNFFLNHESGGTKEITLAPGYQNITFNVDITSSFYSENYTTTAGLRDAENYTKWDIDSNWIDGFDDGPDFNVEVVADLIIDSISLSDTTIEENQEIVATVVVKNIGNKAGASDTLLDFYKDKPSPAIVKEDGDGYIEVGFLLRGETKTFTWTFNAGSKTGSKTFRAFIDSYDDTLESNENNNQETAIYTVTEIDNSTTVTATLENVSWSDWAPENVQWNIGGRTGSGNPATISNVPSGTQRVISSQQPNNGTWLERERWVDLDHSFETGSISKSFSRNLPLQYERTPYDESVYINESIIPTVEVHNNAGSSCYVRVELIVSKSKNRNSPDWSDTQDLSVTTSGRTFSMKQFTPTTAGTYYACYRIRTYISSEWVTTDTGDWGPFIEAQNPPSATVTATLKNIPESDWAPENVEWNIGGKTGTGNGAVISDVPVGADITVWAWQNGGSFFGKEQWVETTTSTVSGSQSKTFTRHLPFGEIKILRANGEEIGTESTVNIGEQLKAQLTVTYPSGTARNVRAVVHIDQNKQELYDFSKSWEAVYLDGGETHTFEYDFTVDESGEFFQTYKVETRIDGLWVATDSGDWYHHFSAVSWSNC